MLVAVLMVVLLGFAAISINVAKLHSERAQLQNGADAAALMIARDCAAGTPNGDCSETPSDRVETIARGNAVDDQSNVDSITIDNDAQAVEVVVGAEEAGSPKNSVSLFFSGVLGLSDTEVKASSKVGWGPPVKGLMFLPLAIAECKLNLSHGSQAAPEQILEFDKGACGRVPGGFAWIASSGSTCSLSISVGMESNATTWFSSDPGASPPTRCSATELGHMNNQTVLLPLYDKTAGTGANAGYFVKGFAAFHVTGYNFASDEWPKGSKLPNKSLRGYFVEFVSVSQALQRGTAPDYGASVVELIS